MACLTGSPTFHFSLQVGFDQSCSPTESKRSEKPSATCRHNVNSSVIDAPVGSMVGLSDDHLMMTSGCRQERLSGDTHSSSTFETSNAHLRELSAHCPRPGSNAERLAHGIPPGLHSSRRDRAVCSVRSMRLTTCHWAVPNRPPITGRAGYGSD